MPFKKPSRLLQGNAAKRAIDSCAKAMVDECVSPRHIADVLRCEDRSEMKVFEAFLSHRLPMVRAVCSQIVSIRGNGDLVVDAIMREAEQFTETHGRAVISRMLYSLSEAKYSGVDRLTALLRVDDSIIVENTFKMFVAVGRADLLFPLVLGGEDERTTERVRRYLNEQGWLD